MTATSQDMLQLSRWVGLYLLAITAVQSYSILPLPTNTNRLSIRKSYHPKLFESKLHSPIKHSSGSIRDFSIRSTDEITNEKDDLKEKMKKEGKIQALWNKYGALYFQVWFCIYLPFLLTFFYVLENNLLQASFLESIDPQAAVLKLCEWLETVTSDPELTRNIKENPTLTNFATAYLMADLVPTTVFALGAVTFILKKREKSKAENDLIATKINQNLDK